MYYLAHTNFSCWKENITSGEEARFAEYANAIHIKTSSNPALVSQSPLMMRGDENVIKVFNNSQIILNISVWTSFEALSEFVYSGIHRDAISNKHLWFEKLETHPYALWWVKQGHHPTLFEAKEKLDLINQSGPSPEAFTFAQHYDANGTLL